ncbi:MAG: hypothetical protein AAF234_04230 [Pseudomonadota bacterium]
MRTIIALCCVVLITAFNGGGIALAKSIDSSIPTFAEQSASLTGAGTIETLTVLESTPVRTASATPSAPSGPCSSADCSWLIPTAASTTGLASTAPSINAASMLLALAEALQLPPPRL